MENEIPDGYTRVSDVLSKYKNFSGIDPEVLRNAANRGERVHRFCELYTQDCFFVPDEDCKHYIESFIEWFDQNVESVEYNEERINSEKLMLSGKFDMIVTLKGENFLTLLDLKTPARQCPLWSLQLAAYQLLIENEWDMGIKNRLILMLPKTKGKAKAVPCENPNDERMFLNALELHRYTE